MSVTLAAGRPKEIQICLEDQQFFATESTSATSTAYHFYQNPYIRLTYLPFNGQWLFAGPTEGEELKASSSASMRHSMKKGHHSPTEGALEIARPIEETTSSLDNHARVIVDVSE